MVVSEHDEQSIREFCESLQSLDTSEWGVGDTIYIRIRCGSSRSVARTLCSGIDVDGRELEDVVADVCGRISRYGAIRQRVFVEALRKTTEQLEDGRIQTVHKPLDYTEVAPQVSADHDPSKPTWADLHEIKGIEALSRAVVSMASASEQRASDAWAASIGFAERYMSEATERMRERAEGMVASARAEAEDKRLELLFVTLAPHLPQLISELAAARKQTPKPPPETEGDEHTPEPSPPERARAGAQELAAAVAADPSVASDATVLASLASIVSQLDAGTKGLIVSMLTA